MKKYAKPKMVAKNAPTGSYAAGCPTHHKGWNSLECRNCDLGAM